MAATLFLTNQIRDTNVACNNLAFDHISSASCLKLVTMSGKTYTDKYAQNRLQCNV